MDQERSVFILSPDKNPLIGVVDLNFFKMCNRFSVFHCLIIETQNSGTAHPIPLPFGNNRSNFLPDPAEGLGSNTKVGGDIKLGNAVKEIWFLAHEFVITLFGIQHCEIRIMLGDSEEYV